MSYVYRQPLNVTNLSDVCSLQAMILFKKDQSGHVHCHGQDERSNDTLCRYCVGMDQMNVFIYICVCLCINSQYIS